MTEPPTYVEVAGRRYLRLVDIGRWTGVGTRQAETWRRRSARNGFPPPVIGYHSRDGQGAHRGLLYDAEEVLAWWEGYVPSKGGAPRGSANGAWTGGKGRRRRTAPERPGAA